jgi:alpha-L-rhamnosidase
MLKINRMHLDYQTNPVGLDHVPQFGWEMESDRRNTVQKAYRLQAAQDPLFETVCYDSGRTESGESAHVSAPEMKICSAEKYYVRVRVSDGIEESGWSKPSYFVTALLTKKEWQAPFVSAENKDSDRECSKGTYVRGTFSVRKKVKSAYAFTTALGLYNFYLNGEKVGDDEMTPGWTSYRKHLMYQTYDITRLLRPGVNVAGAMLGAGWYKGVMGLTKARNNYGDRAAFAMQAVLHYEDGTTETVTTGPSWIGADSPVVFAEIYNGETYDASLEIPDWSSAEHPVGSWHPVVTVPWDTSVLCAQSGSRVKMIDKMPAKRIFTTPKGETVLDFGQNMAGRIHVTASGKPGDVIELRCFEVLDAEGNVYVANLRKAKTAMKYIFGKEGTVTWHPRFTYMGFRYALILSCPGVPKAENFTAYTLHSEMEPVGNITCSNPLLNQLHHNFLWGLKSNFLDIPTDCPQRDERLGWTGDAQIFCRTACYLMNTYAFYSKWLVDVAADQTPEGGVPHVIPNIEEGKTDGNWLLRQGPHSAAAWADVAVIAPWTLYLMYGDKAVLERQYGSMKAWIDFMKNHSDDYIWNYKLQFGDWVALDAKEGSYFGATPNDLTCTAYFAYSTGLFVKAAAVLGKKDVETEYRALYRHIVRKFQETFFDKNGSLTAQTQTAHIVSLYFGLTPKPYLRQTVEGLKRLLAKENGHLVTGFVGTPYFCHALSQNGCVREAYSLLLKEDFPSWLYQVKKGATTIWEHWDGLKPDGTMWSPDMNSFNHYAYGAIGEWMYRVMAGLETDEAGAGFSHAVLYPRIGGNLSYVDAFHLSVYGKVGVRWEVSGSRVTMTVRIPANTTACVRLDRAEKVLENDGLDFYAKDGCCETEAGSGTYRIVYLQKL